MHGKLYQSICSSISSSCLFELYPLNKDNKVHCCGFFLNLPNLEGTQWSMTIQVEVVRLHIQVQGALMFLSVQTKSPRKLSQKDNLRVFKGI